ncbi:hypothetical protein Droror1_Dr00017305 [Drosera rotundifolia]
MGSIAVEKEQHQTDSRTPIKATGSCAHDESIPVETSLNERIEASASCSNFSIRGYVAEVRKRDKKLCFPLCTNDGSNESLIDSYELPPLDVPKFRWWECDGCLRDNGSEKSGEIIYLRNGLSSNPNDIASSSQRSNVAAGLMSPFKDKGKRSQLETRVRQKRELGDICHNNKRFTSFSDTRGKAINYGVDHSSFYGTLEPTSGGVQLDVLLKDRQDDNSVALGSQLKGVFRPQLQTRNSKAPGDTSLGIASGGKSKVDNVTDRSQSGGQAYSDRRNRDLLTVQEDANVTDQMGNATRGRLVPLPDLNMSDNGTENNDRVLGKNPCDDDDIDDDDIDEDGLSGGSRPKIRKTRLLSDILGVRDYRNAEHVMRGDGSPVGSSDRSAGKSKGLVSTDQQEALANANRTCLLIGQKKRTFHDRDLGLPEIQSSGDGTKKLKELSLDDESTRQSTDDSHTESDEDASVGVVSQYVANRSHRVVRNHELEKKAKKAKWEKGGSSMVPRQTTEAIGSVAKTWSAEKQYSSAAEDGSQRTNQLLKSHAMVQQMEKSPITNKKRKASQTARDRSSFFPGKYFALRLCSVVNHGEIQPRNDSSAGKATDHLHDCHLSVENAVSNSSLRDDRLCILSAMQGLKITDDDPLVAGVTVKTNAPTKTHFAATPFARPMSGYFAMNREKSTDQKSNLKGKKKIHSVETDGSRQSEKEIMVSPGMKKQGETYKERGLRQDIDINALPRDDKVLEQRDIDDVPMDIVELMAKHQHERQGRFQKDKHAMLTPNVYPRNGWPLNTSCTSNSYGLRPIGTPNLWQGNFPVMQRPPLGCSARNGVMPGLYDPLPVRPKMSVGPFPEMNRSYLNPGRSHEMRFFSRSDRPARHYDNMPGDLKLSSLSLTSHCENVRKPAQRSSHGSLQGLEPLNRYSSSSELNRSNHVWDGVRPSHMPQGSVIPSSGKEKVRQNNGRLNLWKQNTNSELKLQYSSAVQLLKMMHSGDSKRSTVPYPVARNSQLRWPVPHPDQPYNHYDPGQDFRWHNHGANPRHPSLDISRKYTFPHKLPPPCYSGMPPISHSPYFRNEAHFGSSAIANHKSFAPRAQGNPLNSSVSANGENLSGHHVQTFPYWDGGRERVVPTLDKGKGTKDRPCFAAPPMHGTKELTNQKRPRTQVVIPSPQTEVCVLNRNPAELHQDQARKYMVEGEMLRPVKWSDRDCSSVNTSAKRAESVQDLAASKE